MSGRVLFRNRLDPDNVSASIAWTVQADATPRPERGGYMEMLWDAVSGQTVQYLPPEGSSSIYGSNFYFYDVASNTFTDIGGNDSMANDCTDTWAGSAWPKNRHPYGQMAVDTTRDRLWLFGGVCSGTSLTDMYYLTLNADPTTNAWTRVTPATTPDVQMAASMIYDPIADVLVLFGANTGGSPFVYVYCPSASVSAAQMAAGCVDPLDWTAVTVTGGVYPEGETYGRFVYDSARNKGVLYGGMAGLTVYNDIWEYTVSTKTWEMKSPAVKPPVYDGPSSPPTFAFDYVPSLGKCIYHMTHGANAGETWLYDPVAVTWSAMVSVPSGPSGYDAMGVYAVDEATFVLHTRDPLSGSLDMWQGVLG
jgi:hypothetical protein